MRLPFFNILLTLILYLFTISADSDNENVDTFITKYIYIFSLTLYKASLFSFLLLFLYGYLIIYFYYFFEKTRSFFLKFFFIELGIEILLGLLDFFIEDLNVDIIRTIKNSIEYLSIFILCIYAIFHNLIKIIKRYNYEVKLRGEFQKSLKLKIIIYISAIIMSLYLSIVRMFEYFINKSIINNRFDNLGNVKKIFLSYQLNLLFESIFSFSLVIILFPRKYPHLYFDKVDLEFKAEKYCKCKFNYQILGNINKNQLDIQKKQHLPIVIVNPYFSNENDIFLKIKLGISRIIKNKDKDIKIRESNDNNF